MARTRSGASLEGQTAIVTGGAQGIGLAAAHRLAAEGCDVVIADLNEPAGAAAARDLANSYGIDGRCAQVDVSDEASVARMIDLAMESSASIDVLVHSAGIGLEKRFLDTALLEWKRIIDIDLTGTFLCCQAVAQRMYEARYGRIITLASTAAIRGGIGRAAYGAAKGGVVTLTKVMAVELAPYGITVNALAPGAIETELVARMHSAETRRAYTAAIPMQRYGSPDEVAEAIFFLASEQSRYITGHVFSVDGGFLAAGIMHGS